MPSHAVPGAEPALCAEDLPAGLAALLVTPVAATSAPPALLSPPGASGRGAGFADGPVLVLLPATYVSVLAALLLPVVLLAVVSGAGGLPWALLGGAGGGLLLLSLLLSALAERGSSILCSSCCGSGCACPTLT